MNKNVITCTDLSFTYGRQPVLKSINMCVEPGDFMAVIGPNGGGKSTLLKLIMGRLTPNSGTITVFGQTPNQARGHIGYVPQFVEADQSFPITVAQVVRQGAAKPSSLWPFWPAQIKQDTAQMLQNLSIADLHNRSFGELSGGQRQRVLLARALMAKPKLLLLDEPTASVDAHVEDDIYQLLKQLNKQLTILLVTHDLGFVSSFVNKVTCLNLHSCTHPTAQVSSEILAGVYSGHVQQIQHQCGL